MATPNLALGTNTLTPGRFKGAIGNSATTIIGAVASNNLVNIGGMIVTNNDPANDCWLTLQIDDGTVDVFMYQLNIPAGATLDVFADYKQPPALVETDSLEAIAENPSDLTCFCWYMTVAT